MPNTIHSDVFFCLSGGSVSVCLLHRTPDVGRHSHTAIPSSTYHQMTHLQVCVMVLTSSLTEQVEDLSTQFTHVTVSCPSAGDAAPIYPPSQGYIYAAPVPLNQPNYCQPTPQACPFSFLSEFTLGNLSITEMISSIRCLCMFAARTLPQPRLDSGQFRPPNMSAAQQQHNQQVLSLSCVLYFCFGPNDRGSRGGGRYTVRDVV